MSRQKQAKSISLVMLYMLSIMVAVVSMPSAMAVNETTSGTVSGVETWTGTINLQGDVEVAEGAKLIVNAGTTVNIPYGNFIDVKGAICIGDAACGASAGSQSSQARFIWSQPSDYDKLGRCYVDGSNTFTNGDAACGSGMIIRNTIDQSITSINFAHFEKAYGYPIYVASLQSVQYAALVFDGSTTTANGLSFNDINTSNVIAVDYASPTLTDSTFELGIDGRGYDAAAVRAYGQAQVFFPLWKSKIRSLRATLTQTAATKAAAEQSSTSKIRMSTWTPLKSRTTRTEFCSNRVLEHLPIPMSP